MGINLNVISSGTKGGIQEVLGVVVFKVKGEFVFKYSTSKDPEPEDMELLKIFRNRFVDELEKLNKALGHIQD